jgi:tRNA U34 2-thiouridine synthase MnmA/TrmU
MNRASMKAIALLSGGLDSSLAVKLMIDQGIDVIVIVRDPPRCGTSSRGHRHFSNNTFEKNAR